MIITISGLPGSGKSTVAKSLAKKLGYDYFSLGDWRGRMALQRGLTIDDLNKIGETEDWTDREADKYQEELGKTKDNFIFEGRLSWHFIPNSFKIFLTVDRKEAARRILQNRAERPDEKNISTLAEAAQAIKERIESDQKRYLKYYGLDYALPKHYDLIVDTTHLTARQTINLILDKIKMKA